MPGIDSEPAPEGQGKGAKERTELWRYWEVVFLLAILCTVSSSAASVVL
jgi:hypothetical protein